MESTEDESLTGDITVKDLEAEMGSPKRLALPSSVVLVGAA